MGFAAAEEPELSARYIGRLDMRVLMKLSFRPCLKLKGYHHQLG